MPHRRCRKSSAMFLCGVLVLFFWQSTIYPVNGQTGGETMDEFATKVETTQKLEQNQIVIQKLIIKAQAPIHTQMQVTQALSVEEVKTFEIMMEDSVSQELEKVSENSLPPSRGQQMQERVLKEKNLKEEDAKEQTPEEQTLKVKVSQGDIDLLARVIYAEARGENFEGQVAVGAVVLNRLKGTGFPKTIHGVVYQPGAFTAVIDKQIHLTPNGEAYRAAETALAGQDPTGGALYYFNPKTATDNWIKSRAVIKQIGNHTFSI